MEKQIKKVIARLLVAVLVLQIFSGISLVEVETVTAAIDEKSGLEIVNETQVRARVLELANKLGINVTSLNQNGKGKYFTYNGEGCKVVDSSTGKHTGADCENCHNTKVITADWFKDEDMFGNISSVSLFPYHYDATKEGAVIYNDAHACAGFAAFALWYIAKEDNNSNVNRKYLGESQIQKFTIENLKTSDIRVGDVIRYYYSGKIHSMMFLSMNESAGTIKVLDCNWYSSSEPARVAIHDITVNSNYNIAITRVSNYEPDYNLSLPDTMTSSSSTEAKTNIINYATSLEGWTSSKFTSAGRTDIPSGDWCTWFLKLCGERVGINNLFSSSIGVSNFCTDMIKNCGAQAYYYTDSSYLTSADKALLSGGTAVTKSTFTPQPGDIYILHEDGYDSFSQVGFVMTVFDGAIAAVVGNNNGEVQTRNTNNANYFYQLNNSACPIIGYIRPNYTSLNKVALKEISLSATSATLNVGDTKSLTVTYNPSNTTDSKTVTWKSSDTSVATVSNGKITAVAPGTATITATCGSKTATCVVTVKQPLSKITLNETSLTMSVGTSETLTVTYNPSNTTDSKTVTWKSSNTSVATVSNGKITAIAPGTATITATCGNKTATCTVTVKQPLSGISMSSTKLTLNVGESGTLTVIYNEANTTDSKAVTWKTSNNAIATVSNGKVTAVAPGTVTITATCGSNTATCTVTVNQPLKEITLSDNNIVLDIGETKSLSVSYHPSNTTDNKTLTWSSSNESVVVVSNGKVTAVGAGTATVTAVCGSQTAICTVKVNEAKIDVSISETKIDLEIGSNKTIELIYNAGSLPEGKTLRFKSSNPSVATVSDAGVVTAISSGTVTIIVETSDGEQVAACEVTVQKDDSENTQLPDTEMPGNSEPDTNEPESTETDSEGTDSTATENVDTPSPNNDVNTLLAVIAAICAIGVIGMFGVVIVMMKKRK